MFNSFSQLHGKKVLVTGGSGFIGTNLVEALLNLNCNVLNVSITPPLNPLHFSIYKYCDILDYRALIAVFNDFLPEFVIHLAARTDLKGNSLNDYLANTKGVEHIQRATDLVSSVKFCIYASSRLVFRIDHSPSHVFDYCPTTFYGESKCIGEQLLVSSSENSKPWLILRPTSIWGPWFDIPYRNFFNAILSKKYFHPGSRQILKSFGYVGNAVYQILVYLSSPTDLLHRKVFFLSDFEPINVLSFANLISCEANLPPVRESPYLFLKAVAMIGDALEFVSNVNAPLTSFRLNNLTTNMVYDLSAEKEICGALPFSIHQGVKHSLRWIESSSK